MASRDDLGLAFTHDLARSVFDSQRTKGAHKASVEPNANLVRGFCERSAHARSGALREGVCKRY